MPNCKSKLKCNELCKHLTMKEGTFTLGYIPMLPRCHEDIMKLISSQYFFSKRCKPSTTSCLKNYKFQKEVGLG